MKRSATFAAFCLVVFVTLAVSYKEADTFCVVFPQNGRDIFSVEQRSFIVFREDEIDLIPAVQFEGNARDFGILLPVPAVPQINPAGSQLFSEASFLTQPVLHQTNTDCGGCNNNDVVSPPWLAFQDVRRDGFESIPNGVEVIYERQVGAFLAAVLQATSATALTEWLNDNNYHYNPADSAVLDEYVQRDWKFVAMKLDTTQVPPYIDQWWSAFTAPAKITFPHEGESLTYPLKISAISTKSRSDVLIYTVDSHPRRYDGADVEYANLVTKEEARAIAERYPTLSEFVVEGTFLTKLRKSFTKAEMQRELTLYRTDDFSEFREVRYADNSLRGGFLLAALLGIVLLRRKSSPSTDF